MKAIQFLAPAVVILALLAESTPGSSQNASPGSMHRMGPGMMEPGMTRQDRMNDMMGGGCPMMGMSATGEAGPAYSDGRIAFLKAELAITDTQKTVWDAYASVLRKNLESMQGMRQSMMAAMQAGNPVERLDSHINAMETRLAALREVKPTLSDLYSALTAEQKSKADALLTGMGCMK